MSIQHHNAQVALHLCKDLIVLMQEVDLFDQFPGLWELSSAVYMALDETFVPPWDNEGGQIEDRAHAEQLMKALMKVRRLNDATGNRYLRHRIDEHLTRSYLIARDGTDKKMNSH